MRIAFAMEHCAAAQGGAEQYAAGLARWLIALGHSVDIYASRIETQADACTKAHELTVPARPRSARPRRFAEALARALEGTGYDVVHGFNHVWPCDVLRLGGGVHLAFEDFNAQSAPTAAQRIIKRLSYRCLPWPRALRENERHQFADPDRQFIAVSGKVARDMERFYPASRNRIHLIRNGVDLGVFNPQDAAARRAEARRALGLAPDTLALLFVSNNFRLKGLHDLVRALPRVVAAAGGSVELLVVGRGDAGPFERAAARAGVRGRVRFLGPQADLRDSYAAADLLVHPSYYDAFGFVILEAAASGLPAVVSRNCGASEILRDGDGTVLIDMPCSSGALADAVLRAADPGFRGRAREAQWQLVQQHRIELNYEAVQRLYEQVAARKTQPRI
jgi:UDP-glucose:(heptosyl)LPS alpha-1,3-glucosyltransferase